MNVSNPIVVAFDDYAQSANTLFHFMNKKGYLEDILTKKAIVPRYCIEDVAYLNIKGENVLFNEIAVLQKCFCDIPLHKLTTNFELDGFGRHYNSLNEQEKTETRKNNTHPDFYGKYAIAFSKNWAEQKNLQPIHYLNEKSSFAEEFTKVFQKTLISDEISNEYADDILNRLSFIKPLRGLMKRMVKTNRNRNVAINFYKNFHDEQEWRYVPNSSALSMLKLEKVIANPNVLKLHDYEKIIDKLSKKLTEEKYKSLWITYNYDDIRYIIVPDTASRISLIDTIMNISEEKISEGEQGKLEKYVLISKILVLDEIRKDW